MTTITIAVADKTRLAALKGSTSYGAEVHALIAEHDARPAPTPPPAPPPSPTALPVRLILVAPSDKYDPATDLLTTPAGTYKLADGLAWLRSSWAARFNLWLKPSGHQLNFSVLAAKTALTTKQIGTANDGTDIRVDGYGASGDVIFSQLRTGVPELLADAASGNFRHSYVIPWAGGYAGGFCGSDGKAGQCAIGDPEFSGRVIEHVTGKAPGTVLDPIGGGDVTKDGRSWSHEMLHMLGMYCHAGNDFSTGAFAVPGTWEPIDSRFTSFPLNVGGAPGDVQYDGEHRLYPGALAQLERFSWPWLV